MASRRSTSLATSRLHTLLAYQNRPRGQRNGWQASKLPRTGPCLVHQFVGRTTIRPIRLMISVTLSGYFFRQPLRNEREFSRTAVSEIGAHPQTPGVAKIRRKLRLAATRRLRLKGSTKDVLPRHEQRRLRFDVCETKALDQPRSRSGWAI